MKKLICILLVLILTASCVNIIAAAYDSLPAPDWITVTLNPDTSKTVSFVTPTYMIDKVDYYEYSTDSFLTVQKLSNKEGGEIIFDKTTEFSLRYYSSGIMSETHTVSVVINKTTVITNQSTNISIVIPFDSSIPKDITLSGYEITGGNDYNSAKKAVGEDKKFRLFNIAVLLGNNEYKTDIPYNYLFPGGDFDVRCCKIYSMDSQGKITLIESSPEMNALTFITDRTGLFLIAEDKTYCMGDMNGDGKILASDARIALRISAKLESPDEQQIISGDINNNGKIDAADARKILRAAASLETL